jgi:prefoldin subunit 5
MNVNTFPLPVSSESVDFGTEAIIDEYTREIIEPNVFDEETLFAVLLIGEEPASKREEIVEMLQEDRSVKRAEQLAKIEVATIGEQRLNDFILSLMYNCLETDPGRDPAEVITDDGLIPDDVRRKIDFYLPRVHERVEEVSQQLTEGFNERRETLFPVNPSSGQARNLYQTLSDDIVSHDPIVDHLLLAGAASEARKETKDIVSHIRGANLDSQGLLSKTGSAAGYSRVFENAYNLTSKDFFPRFKEAISLYESGITSIQTLSSLYSAPNYTNIYPLEHPAKDLLVSQFPGGDQELAKYVLEAALASQIIGQSGDEIAVDYRETREELNEKIDAVEGLLDEVDELDDTFDSEKVKYNATSPAFLASSLVTEVNKSDTAIIQFLFGVDRSQRTSVFTTVRKNLEDERQKLSSNIGTIRSRVDRISELDAELDSLLDTVDTVYTEIEESTVDLADLPAQSAVKTHLETEWEATLEDGIRSLSEVDVSIDQNEFMDVGSDWGEQIRETDEELNELRTVVNTLDDLRDHLVAIDDERADVTEVLATIDNTLGGDT